MEQDTFFNVEVSNIKAWHKILMQRQFLSFYDTYLMQRYKYFHLIRHIISKVSTYTYLYNKATIRNTTYMMRMKNQLSTFQE